MEPVSSSMPCPIARVPTTSGTPLMLEVCAVAVEL
jgi:hypothetical protein